MAGMDEPQAESIKAEEPAPGVALPGLFSLKVACQIIPMPTVAALSMFLFRHKDEFEPRYRQRSFFVERFLTMEDIVRIREMCFSNGAAVMARRLEKRRMAQSGAAMAGIMRRAMSESG